MRRATPITGRGFAAWSPIPLQTFRVLAKAGFRRYATYRQATLAGIFTNTVFGFLRCYVMLAAAAAAGTLAGYQGSQLVSYVWVGQGLIATVGLWGDTELATRIRSGDVVSDLLRPINPVFAYFGGDMGRAGYALLTRFAAPVVVGLIAFDFYLPRHAATYPLFAVSTALAVALSYACRYVVNSMTYWTLDGRGPQILWSLASTVLGGLYFPLRFLPSGFATALWLGTPFPSLLQTPLDIACERQDLQTSSAYVALQALWVAAMFAVALAVQRLAERKMVVQGG